MVAMGSVNTSARASLFAETVERERARMGHIRLVTDEPATTSDPIVTYDNGGIVLATVKDVPLLNIGMKYPASTGNVDFSFQHLSAAVSAGADPMVPRARIKLGHTDPRYNECACPNCGKIARFDFNDTYTLDGDPAVGFVTNVHLTNDGGQISADFEDVPLWLASIMPVAFASRSVEGWFGYEGPNQKEYDFVLTACALLGVCFPGIMNLADLPKLYGSEMPDFVQIQEAA